MFAGADVGLAAAATEAPLVRAAGVAVGSRRGGLCPVLGVALAAAATGSGRENGGASVALMRPRQGGGAAVEGRGLGGGAAAARGGGAPPRPNLLHARGSARRGRWRVPRSNWLSEVTSITAALLVPPYVLIRSQSAVAKGRGLKAMPRWCGCRSKPDACASRGFDAAEILPQSLGARFVALLWKGRMTGGREPCSLLPGEGGGASSGGHGS